MKYILAKQFFIHKRDILHRNRNHLNRQIIAIDRTAPMMVFTSKLANWLPVLVSSRGIASNRISLAADHFSDATDLTALPFDQLPTTFFIALPFLHRPLIVGGDVATSVTPPWARHREREKERKNKRERERIREKTRAAKETARPRWKDVYTAQQEARSLCPSNRVASRQGELLAIHALLLPQL